jgi:hypothetical protein
MTVTLYPLASHGIKLYLPGPLHRWLVVQSLLAEREGQKRAGWKAVVHYVWEFLMLNECEK